MNGIHIEYMDEILCDEDIRLNPNVISRIVRKYDDAVSEEMVMYQNGIKSNEVIKHLSKEEILDKVKICPKCDGVGIFTIGMISHVTYETCDECKGKGIVMVD